MNKRAQSRSAARLAAVQALYQHEMEGTPVAQLLDPAVAAEAFTQFAASQMAIALITNRAMSTMSARIAV